jgi:hypothetical protein
MNRRRILSSIHRDIARKPINAAAWFGGQSFHHSAADMPFERIPTKELDKAGAALLPRHEDEHELTRCAYCGEVDDQAHDAARCAINAENS